MVIEGGFPCPSFKVWDIKGLSVGLYRIKVGTWFSRKLVWKETKSSRGQGR